MRTRTLYDIVSLLLLSYITFIYKYSTAFLIHTHTYILQSYAHNLLLHILYILILFKAA